jgi:formimidoylglutamate deiminase
MYASIHIMSRHKGQVMIFAKQALLATGWAQDVRISCAAGRIAMIQTDVQPLDSDIRVPTLLPALANVHSHTFQRAMAGMTEYRTAGRDSFWTWRDLMYRFVAHLTPDHIQAIAALAFLEMQETGFAAVGEFHYLHHGPNGRHYDNIAEVSARIFAAAEQTGIGLTHLPVLYSYGGAGKLPLTAGQTRFGNSVDDYHALRAAIDLLPRAKDTQIGFAPHSLRATCPADLARIIPDQGPIHLHIAEQPQEVRDVAAWLGARPVEWMLDHTDIGPNWCMIHATHMTKHETIALAKTGAVAGLCPITEANLGDGPFQGALWSQQGGQFGLGSDSNIRISMIEELRSLEYSQRLRDLGRNIMGGAHTGDYLYQTAALGGAAALGRDTGQIAMGKWADLVAIDHQDPMLCALGRDKLLDGLVFAASDRVIRELWSAGRHMVQQGRHIHRNAVIAAYRQTIAELIAVI